jgi:malonyl-CoA/methylmalonyl-CoA synthetase
MLLDLFDGALADRRDELALGNLTYGAFHDGARRVAHQLARLGIRSGDRVAIFCENGNAFALAYVAALRLGAIAVPLNVLYRARELAHVLNDAQPALSICSQTTAPFLAQTGTSVRTVDAAQIELWAQREDLAPLRSSPPPDPEAIALIVYTSGTTGTAKGAMLSHRSIAAIATQLGAAWRWQARDTLLLTLPLFHVHGLIAGLTSSLCAGGSVVLHERFDADRVLERLAQGGISMFFGVPTMYVRLLERAEGTEFPPLRLFVSGSAALSASTHEAFEQRFGASILERYGATEFGFALSNRYAGPRVAGSVGVPLPGVSVRVAAPGTAEAVDGGDVGELLVAGPNVFSGYWNRPDATAEAFVADASGARWYRSGDLAAYDTANGVYRIVGRIKELIISGGFNVYPREVELAIERFPGVRACAVVGKPDAARGELPVAFVEAAAGLEVDSLLRSLQGEVASFKIPKEVYVLDELPRNAMGKLDKPALKQRVGTS